MVNHHLIHSGIAASFSDIHNLICLIYSTRNPHEQKLAVQHLWRKTSQLKALVQTLQTEHDKALPQQQPDGTHPFQEVYINPLPVQGAELGYGNLARSGHPEDQQIQVRNG